MKWVIFSKSKSYLQHVKKALVDSELRCLSRLTKITGKEYAVIHTNSYTHTEILEYFSKNNKQLAKLTIAEEIPSVEKMLDYTQRGILTYCNAYMAKAHYQQLIELISKGQSWYPPYLLAEVFSIAHKRVNRLTDEQQLQELTSREKQIALSVAEGKSNKLVAREYGISERTVKAHLTHIFEKLQVKDRVALVIYLKEQGLAS